jgi:YVTN family beta-propeller protein
MEEERKKKTILPNVGRSKVLPIFFIFGLFLFFALAGIFSQKAFAATAPAIITYQGKLLTANHLATTTQSIYFVLYDAPSGGVALYTASGTTGLPLPVNITPTQGLFSINLGDVGTNAVDPVIFQNNNSVYLEVRIGSDILTPRKRITSVPYAFNAKYLDGIGVNTLSSTVYIPRSDSSGNFSFNSTTISTSTITTLTVLGNASLGTVTVGNWNGSVISPFYGGTGQNSSAWTGFVKVTAGTWSTTSSVSLTADVNGVLSIANGGTNATTLGANGSIIYSDGVRYAASAVGAAGQILQSTGSGAPVWVPTSSLGIGGGSYSEWTLATSTSDIGYSVTSGIKVVLSGINGITTTRSGSEINIGLTTNGVVAGAYGSVNAVPIFTVDAFGRMVSVGTTSIAINGNQITSGTVSAVFGGTGQDSSGWSGLVRVTAGVWATTTVNLASDVTGVLSIARGGTNTSTLGANGSIIYSDGISYAAAAVGASGQILQSTGSGAPVWVPTSSLGFVNLQGSFPGTQQLGNFNISGRGIVGTSFGVGTSTVSSTLTIQGSAGLDLISVVSSTGNSIFKILSDGRIGINSSTPSASLTLQGTVGVNPLAIVSSTGGPLINVLANGNVGIGTSTPTQKLTVIGNISNIIDNGTIITQVATTSVGDNPTSVFVSGKYAYVANAGADTLSVVDISSPAAPVQIGTANVGDLPFSVYVSGRYAYVANFNSNNVSIVDVSNPAAPTQVSTVAVGNSPQTLFVSGRYIYVANNGSDTMSVVDVANPLLPVQIATTSVGVGPTSVYVSGKYAYVANNSSDSMSVVDISNPATPNQVATVSVGTGPYDIKVSGRYAYVLNYSASTISVVDISNSVAPVVVATFVASNNPDAIFISGRYLYISTSGLNLLSVVDISNPLAPAQVATASVGNNPVSVYVSGRYAYLVNSVEDSFSVVDISGAEVTSLIAHSAEVGNIQSRNDIFAQGNVMAGTSLLVGSGGIMSQGSLSIFASSTGSTSSIFNIASSASSSILKVFANGKIGINSSSPFATLSVNGDLAVTGGIYDSAGTRGTVGQILQTNGTVVNWVSTSSLGIGTVGNGLAGQIAYYAVDGTGVVGTSSLFVSSSGNIGINTTTPSARLTIVGSASGSILDVVSSAGSSTFRILSNGRIGINSTTPSASLSIVGVGSVNPFAITSSSGSSLVQVLTNGNVGIGTSTPTQKLSVVGNISNIIDVNTAMSVVTSVTVGAGPTSVVVSGKYAYTANGLGNTMSVVDVSNPSSPVQIATTAVGSGPSSIFVSGRYAYVANQNSSSVSVVDISNPATPVQAATAGVESGPSSIFVSGRYAYVANQNSSSVSVVDISNPAAPVQVSRVDAGIGPRSIFVSGRYAYVANVTSVATDYITIIDVSNPLSPVRVASSTIGPFASPASIFVSGRYAYVANTFDETLSIFDISNPLAATQVSTVAVGSEPASVFVSGRYAYVTNNADATISVVDISNAAAPVRVTTVSVGLHPKSIFVSGRYAYVTRESSNLLSIIDISGTEVSSLIAHSAEVGNIQSRNDIFAQGNIMAGTSLMVGGGGIMSQGGLSVFASSTGTTSSIFSISSPQVASILRAFPNGSVAVGTSTASSTLTIQGAPSSLPLFSINSSTGSTLLRVLANGNLGVGTSTPTQKLSVVGNISNIIDSNTSMSVIATTSVGSSPSSSPFSVFVSGRYAYVANNASNTMSVIDISNPATPVQIATTSVGTGPEQIVVSGRYAYVANTGSDTLSVVDISNPRAPRQVGVTAAISSGADTVFVSGRYAYVGGVNGISVVDVANPLSPVEIATAITGLGNTGSVYVSGRYIYAGDSAAGLIAVIDISNPALPLLVATTTVGSHVKSIYVSGRYAYTANQVAGTMSVVDISNPAAPVQVSTVSIGTQPYSVYVSGRYAYVANLISHTISVVDISNPLAPAQVSAIPVSNFPSSVFVSGRYAYVSSAGTSVFSVIDISGTEVTSLMAHSAEVGNFQSRNDIFAQGNIMAGTSLLVGAGGIMSQGTLSIFASSTGATSSIFNISSAASSSIFKVFANGKVGIGTSTFSATSTLDVQGQVEVNLTSPTNATFALCHSTNGAADNQVIYDCNGTASADYMEMYAADEGLELGDVVVFSDTFITTADGNSIPKLSKSTAAYQAGLVGVISDAAQAGDFNSIGHNVAGEDNPLPLALSGRIRIKVTNANGDIHVGDKLTSSNIPGVAMKATGEGPTIAIAMGEYSSSVVGTVMGFVNLNWNNTLYQGLTLDVNSQTINIGSSSTPHNLMLTGNLSLSGSNVVHKLSFANSALFESSVVSEPGARAFTFNAINFSGSFADSYIISLRANNNSVFSVAANGDVHALGNYYGASAVFGTSTNPGDLAERVDIAPDDEVEAGDVVMVDSSAPDTYRRSNSAYEQSVAGVISTNPTIVVGNGRTDYTAVMAMVGRVPVKVSAENGAIARGDLLVAASLAGYAMKYNAATDTNTKMVGVIGVALESLPASSTGKILALIRTGWVYNRDKDIDSIQGDIERLATAQGINLNSDEEPGDLTVENTNNQLVYSGGNLDLQNNSLVNVATILGKNNKWKIDEFGNLIQKIATATGEKEIYGLQSAGKQEIVISGTSTLENGIRRVVLTELDQAIIDQSVPLKISITMSGETNGYYVSERNFDSFVVKENGNGQSNAPFDWIVIAKVLPAGASQSNPGPEPESEPPISPVNSESETPSSSPEAEESENVSVPTSTPESEPQLSSEGEQISPPTTTP